MHRADLVSFAGGGYGFSSLGYYVQVHVLAGIGNKSGGSGDIWIHDLWFRAESIDDPPSEAMTAPGSLAPVQPSNERADAGRLASMERLRNI
jgi:hypothetical protein